MTVYLDGSRNRFRRMIMCHMIADTLDELHDMAQLIGMQREWFQDGGRVPHYDVSLERRALAIACGAVVLSRSKFVQVMRKNRK